MYPEVSASVGYHLRKMGSLLSGRTDKGSPHNAQEGKMKLKRRLGRIVCSVVGHKWKAKKVNGKPYRVCVRCRKARHIRAP